MLRLDVYIYALNAYSNENGKMLGIARSEYRNMMIWIGTS